LGVEASKMGFKQLGWGPGAFFTMNDVIFDGLGVFNGEKTEKTHHNSRDSSGGNGDNGD